MESLKAEKFKLLTKEQQLIIKGGIVTPGKSEVLYYNFKVVNGVRYQQAVIRSYSSDDIDGRDECYTGLEYCTGEWTAK